MGPLGQWYRVHLLLVQGVRSDSVVNLMFEIRLNETYLEIIRLEILPCPSRIASHVRPPVVLLVRPTREHLEVCSDDPTLRSAIATRRKRERTDRAASTEDFPSPID